MMKKLLLVITAVFIFSTSVFGQAITLPKSQTDSLSSARREYSTKAERLKSSVDSLKALRDTLMARLQRQQTELKMQKAEVYYKKYGREDGAKVINGRVWAGMTEDMMKDSWGEPDSVTVNDQKWGKFTQWYYGDITYFFKNGKLTDWEEKGKSTE